MVTAKREIMLNLPTQHKLGILQRLIVTTNNSRG